MEADASGTGANGAGANDDESNILFSTVVQAQRLAEASASSLAEEVVAPRWSALQVQI